MQIYILSQLLGALLPVENGTSFLAPETYNHISLEQNLNTALKNKWIIVMLLATGDTQR